MPPTPSPMIAPTISQTSRAPLTVLKMPGTWWVFAREKTISSGPKWEIFLKVGHSFGGGGGGAVVGAGGAAAG